MKKTLMAIAAVATLAVSAMAPTSASAQHWRGHGGGGAVAAGLIGGALLGGAIAAARDTMVPATAITAVLPMWPARAITAIVSGNVSVFGTAMAGAFAASACAAEIAGSCDL